MDTGGLRFERTSRGEAGEDYAQDFTLPQPPTFVGRFTHALARIGGKPGTVQLSAADRDCAQRRLAGESQRVYRLYTEDGLTVRTKVRKKLARRARVPTPRATRPNAKWSMDFLAGR